MKDKQAEDLARAISHWIGYQMLCGRENLLSEMYLGIPIGEFLISNSNWKVEAEWPHPNFRSPGRGRPKQIDFIVKSSEKQHPIAAIEVKWIRNIVNIKQNIIDDILRLECLRNEHKRGICRYLVLAGFRKDFDELLDSSFNNNGQRKIFFDQLFSKDGEKGINVHDLLEGLRGFFKEFSKSYYHTELPKKLSSKKIYFKEGDKYSVGIWKVESSRNRKSFKPDDNW